MSTERSGDGAAGIGAPSNGATAIGATAGLRRGVVAAFDWDEGLGLLRETGGSEHHFHCTAIADGTRNIAVGTQVVFRLAPGHLGRFEAAAIETLASPGS